MSYLTKTSRELFNKDYYQTRNYNDYLKRKFSSLASDLISFMALMPDDKIVDFGCGYGGLVAAMDVFGLTNVVGTDISHWAIEEGHRRFPHLKDRLQFYNRDLLRRNHDVLIMLDVLEHMPEYEAEIVLKLAHQGCKKLMAVRIPVSAVEGEPFVLPVSNNDPTHISCHTKQWWTELFKAQGFEKSVPFGSATIYDSPGVMAQLFTIPA